MNNKKAPKTKKVVKKPAKAVKKTVVKTQKNEKKVSKSSKLPLIIVVALIVIIAIVVAIVYVNKNKVVTENVSGIEELTDKLHMPIKAPTGADEVEYSIEGNNVACISYRKKVFSGGEMNFVMKSSSSMEDIMAGENYEWGIPILMTVICNDESEIEVESYISSDNNNVMIAKWYDNDLYYMMTTDNLVTREDFLQEVNRVIIDNHVEF